MLRTTNSQMGSVLTTIGWRTGSLHCIFFKYFNIFTCCQNMNIQTRLLYWEKPRNPFITILFEMIHRNICMKLFNTFLRLFSFFLATVNFSSKITHMHNVVQVCDLGVTLSRFVQYNTAHIRTFPLLHFMVSLLAFHITFWQKRAIQLRNIIHSKATEKLVKKR